MSVLFLTTNYFECHSGSTKNQNTSEFLEKESKANEKAGLDGLSMTQLAEVEKILGGGNMQTFDSKADHEKLTSDAKTKSMKLFGDAKERKAAKKKEAQKQSISCIKLIKI